METNSAGPPNGHSHPTDFDPSLNTASPFRFGCPVHNNGLFRRQFASPPPVPPQSIPITALTMMISTNIPRLLCPQHSCPHFNQLFHVRILTINSAHRIYLPLTALNLILRIPCIIIPIRNDSHFTIRRILPHRILLPRHLLRQRPLTRT
jgi:hypothetical protein